MLLSIDFAIQWFSFSISLAVTVNFLGWILDLEAIFTCSRLITRFHRVNDTPAACIFKLHCEY
ncbi:predicted protein [Plenodomus lingam JN3]|uniref:Predicted protein n=1 Tax=Leptosphaeria maculans (strain JN3 / isolate v23.1.3 / race Av1-4-5-6-7-8) TaxID=985895 RepID=E4ZXW0_LEPMJ|nr:predicted protein [Plenodomus lingam JN3]CBX96205.1 predicted protein [Plenodomus lingam JN3]